MCNIFLAINSIDIFFILIIMILMVVCLLLWFAMNKLKEKVERLELENKNILEHRVMKRENSDAVSIQNISKEKMSSTSVENNFLNSKKSLENISKNLEEKEKYSKEELSIVKNQEVKSDRKNECVQNVQMNQNSKEVSFPSSKEYQKNVLSNKNRMVSPVSISLENSNETYPFVFDLNEFVKKSEKVVPKINKQTTNVDYLKKLSDQMASELKSQTIELTDYEKEQEEHAIISYQELLSIKNQLNIIDDEEDAIDFIEDLKNLRNRLN